MAYVNTSDAQATMTFGQVIRQRRMELGLTQESLAARVGDNVRQADISRLERDYITMPRRSRLEALAQALDVSAGYLLMQSGWFQGDHASPEDMKPDSPAAIAVVPTPGTEAEAGSDGLHMTQDIWLTETTVASAALHEAILRARQLSSQTRDVLTQSANTVDRAGRIRRRD